MILLDTNVISELMRAERSSAVMSWLARYGTQDLRTTVITKAEILFGIAQLREGRRRRALSVSAGTLFELNFSGRILPFEEQSTRPYADIVSSRFRQGRPIEPLDAMIAAIALANGAAVATRNVSDFQGCGIALHDPWSES